MSPQAASIDLHWFVGGTMDETEVYATILLATPTVYDNSYQISQGPGFVAIHYEMIHETRLIPVDDRAHIGPTIRSYMGDARGHWEGNTLVVETTNFREETT